MDFVKFTGYAPDLPPETQGVFTDCSMTIPLPDGFKAQGSLLSAGVDTLSGAARGFASVKKPDSTRRIFAATQTKLYELTGTTWTDVSRVGDYDLGSDPEVRARFAQFGNVTIAAVGTNNRIQSSTTGDFADITGAPYAKVVETVNNFVFCFNFVDDTNGLGTRENGWICSALGDETDWVPSVSTQCVSGQFLETPGPVIGGKRLGSTIIAYKENSAFIGQYVGVPQVWNWTQLPGEVGAMCQEAIVNVGTAHFLIGPDDFWMFDGSRFTPIGSPLRNTFFSDLSEQHRSRITSSHDKANALIYWFYPSNAGGGTIDKCIVYNYKTNQWGRSDVTVEAVSDFVDAGVTYDDVGTLYSTYDDLPTTVSYDSSFWVSESPSVAVFNSSHVVQTFSGTPSTSSITTGHYGDVASFSTITKVRPRFLVTPTSSTLEYSHSNTNADAMTQNLSSTLTNNVYDLIWSARWHKFKFNFVGNSKITGFMPELTYGGAE